MDQLSNKKRVRDDSDESELDSPEVKRLRDDLLSNLDDSDLSSTSPDLDSFMKSFYDEISASSPPPLPTPPAADLTSDSGESQPDFGFLLEASDDELGIPPSTTVNGYVELDRISSDSSGELGELWRFDDQFPSYDSFEFGLVTEEDNFNGNYNGEFAALDGIFDYSDLGFGFTDGPTPLWRPETTPLQ